MRNEKGQAAVEFALVLPFLILLICGVIDFGRLLYTANALTGVCERGARYASINASTKDDANIQAYVNDNVPAGIDKTRMSLPEVTPSPSRTTGGTVNVSFYYDMDYVTPFISNLLSSSYKRLNFDATCRVE